MTDDKPKPEVPRLAPEIKRLNGRSGKKLSKCIDDLCEILDQKDVKDEDKLSN